MGIDRDKHLKERTRESLEVKMLGQLNVGSKCIEIGSIRNKKHFLTECEIKPSRVMNLQATSVDTSNQAMAEMHFCKKLDAR